MTRWESSNSSDAKCLEFPLTARSRSTRGRKEQNYQFPLLSDYNKEVSPAYDSMYGELLGFKGVSNCSAYVIDSQGKVRYREVLEDARQLPNFEAIKKCLKEIS